MLDLKPFSQTMADLDPGETIRVNHTECEAGEDTRRRLYLTRTHADETRVIAYCHNCQQGGYHSDGHYSSYRDAKHKGTPKGGYVSTHDTITEPHGMERSIALWPTAAKAWAIRQGIHQIDADFYHIKYDPSSDRVYLPRWDRLHRGDEDRGELVGYQLRQLHEYQSPKYMTAQLKDAQNYTFIHPKQGECDYVVIVEDLVSAIHILRATEDEGQGANLPGVFINYGTRIDPTMMFTISRDYAYAVVWLDNDNQHVVNQAKLMERTIAMYSPKIMVARVDDKSDPKHHEPMDICHILDEVWNG